MTKEKIKQVIVVEGHSDTQNLQNYFDVHTIETNGSAINASILDQIVRAHQLYGVIVFTDPDISGTKIRQAVVDRIPDVQHAFLTRDEAKPLHKGSLGIEHADFKALSRALKDVYTIDQSTAVPSIPMRELQALGLVGTSEAKQNRDWLAEKLHLGHVNGKQLAKRLQLFQLTLEDVKTCLLKREEERDG